MRFSNFLLTGLIATTGMSETVFASDLASAIKNGSVNGNIKAYYNTRDFETKTDEEAFALGGAIRAETGPWGPVKLGVGFYTAQDLDTNDDDPAKVNKRLGSDLEVLGEAYVKTSMADNTLTIGRQKLSTPFANPGDAFIIPFTFEAASLKNNSIENLSLELDLIQTIKNRNSDEFVDVGIFSTRRFGAVEADTSGTLVFGASYKVGSSKLQAWYYNHAELFNTIYLQVNHKFAANGDIKPFIAGQFGSQSDTGDKLLGTVDSTLYGVQGGAAFGKAKLTLAFNSVAEETSAFKNGAFLAPYNFSTSPLFTNNMLQTVENVDAGDAYKVTFNYSFTNAELKLSYADFDFKTAADRDATDFDITYKLDNVTKGLSARWRVEVVSSDTKSVEQTNHRFQLMMKY